jgi:predicted phosphoadenosine phosphosulfate sulfurtransferase
MYSTHEKRHDAEDAGFQPAGMSTLQRFETPGINESWSDPAPRTRPADCDVLEATRRRLELIFRDFEHVLVAFSCGKDSGVLLNLTYRYAKENGMLHKLAFYYEDYEADYRFTHEYAERTFEAMHDVRRWWLCLPISAACAASMYETRWIPWDADKKDIWVRPMPKGDYVVHEGNCPYPFVKGTKGFDARIQFSQWFSKKHGKTAVLIGIRADESLTRRAIITSQHRTQMHKGLSYSKIVDHVTINFYPIYDWKTQDIWVANAKLGLDYNKVYDLYYQAGLSIDQMRVASPFHQSGQENLKLYKVIDPNTWGKMVGRVNGVNFTGIYGGTTAMGWKSIIKPSHFTWKQYAEFLLSTLPEGTKKKFEHQIERFRIQWAEKGRGRNPEVIEAMKREGLDIDNTKQVSKLCKKQKLYEIVRIKSPFPDELVGSYSTPFRHCPSWKAICITIMKNDIAMTYMGLTRTKDQNISRQQALDKYQARKAKQSAAVKEEDEDIEEA